MRPIEVCKFCREKKVKCDRQLPMCASCRKSNVRCIYATKTSIKSPSVSAEGSQLWNDLYEANEIQSSKMPYDRQGDDDVATATGNVVRDSDTCHLKFINYEHPSSAQSAETRNIIRSHVMSNVRRRQKKQKSQSDFGTQGLGPLRSKNSKFGNSKAITALQLAPLYQPSQANIVQQYLVSNFISLNPQGTSTIGSFFAHIPHFISDSTFRPLRQATMAVITNHYGTVVRDKSIQLQSRVPYIGAVNGLLKVFLQAGSTRNVRTELGIYVAILLMVYELRTGETGDGWANHGRGAERLFLTLHPEVYQKGPSHDAVRFLRYVVSVLACTERTPTALAREPWKSYIFAVTPKRRDDALLDSLVLIPSYIYEMDCMRSKTSLHTAIDIEKLYKNAMNLRDALDSWLATYLVQDYEELSKYLPVRSEESHKTTHYLWIHQDRISKDELYHFTTGMILTLSVLQDTCPPTGVPSLYSAQIVNHAGFILSILPHINQQWGVRNGPITLVLPLKLIAKLSPDPEQRQCASNKLAGWDKGIGAGGYLQLPDIKVGNLYTMDNYDSYV